MLSRVSTTRGTSLFLHSLHPRLSFTQSCYPLSALASSNEITYTAGTAPYLFRHLNTAGHLLNAPCNNGTHGPVCKIEGHPLAHHAGIPSENRTTKSVHPEKSAFTVRRRKGHSSPGDGKVSERIDANGQDVKASESDAKVSRKKGQARSREMKVVESSVKLSCSKASRKASFLSYGDVNLSESEACSQAADSHFRDGIAQISTCEASRDDQGHFGHGDPEATVCKECVGSTEICSPTSKETRKVSFLSYGGARHVSDASSGPLYPSLPLQNLLIHSLPKEGKMESQIAMLELQRKVEVLEAENMSAKDAARLFKTRAFRSASCEHLSAVLQVFKESFGMGESPCQALANSSKYLVHPVELLQQTLKVLDDFHIKREIAGMLFSRDLIGLKVELLQKRLSCLKELGLTVEALNRICNGYPKILRSSVQNCILRNQEFLMRTGFTKERLLKLLWRWPRILACSLDDNLIMKCKYFRQLGFSDKNLCKAIEHLARLSIEKLQVRVESVKDLGFSDEDVQRMITQQPNLLTLTTENLKGKLDFLVHEQNRGMAEIAKYPICLLYSLHGRIVPRFKIIGMLGLSKVYTLSTILCTSNVQFKSKFRVVRGSGRKH